MKLSHSLLVLFWLGFFSLPKSVLAQPEEQDSMDISLNITNYFFTYDFKFSEGSYAVGPTITLNAHGKGALQLGILYDFQKYVVYERGLNAYGNPSYLPVSRRNIFIPATLQYNYFRSNKINLYLTGGFIVEGLYTINVNGKSEETSLFNFTFGTGISYHISKWLWIHAYPSLRFNSGYFFPGLTTDICFVLRKSPLNL